jgi:hypothetical protein
MDQYLDDARALAKELSVSEACATDVQYLRSRHRWTPELERELIALHAEGNPPDMMSFGVTPETQAALMRSIEKTLADRGIHLPKRET